MYKLLSSLNLSQTFPNVEIAKRIYLCIMVSNASNERSFSKVGKGRKGSAIFSRAGKVKHADAYEHIEHELLRRHDFTDTIEEFVSC